MENLYWKFHGIFEDIYYYVTALPRFILYWGEKSPLNITFTDDKSSNYIDLKDIYKSMVLVM